MEHQSMLSNIPAELKALPQWVVTDSSKMPHDAKTGGAASVIDPSTWATYEQACSKLNGKFSHVGFVFTESDPFTGIDLDANGVVEQRIIDALDSYTERSRSGRGHHVIVRGKAPACVRRDTVEVYPSKHYFIMTGDVVRSPPFVDRSELLATLVGEMDPAESVPLVDLEETQSDADLFAMAMRAANADKFNDLCEGKWKELGHPSQSEADFALLSILAHYTQSNEQVRRLFRMSALGKREMTCAPSLGRPGCNRVVTQSKL